MSSSKKEKQFREDYYNYYSVIYSTIYSRIKAKEDAEDICNLVFMSYYHKMDQVEDTRNWLIGAVRFEISNFYRKKEKGVHKEDMIDIDDASYDPNLAFVNGARDVRIIIGEALQAMTKEISEKEHIIFDLIAINHFTYKQASKQLGITERQAKYYFSKAQMFFIDFLRKKGINNLSDVL